MRGRALIAGIGGVTLVVASAGCGPDEQAAPRAAASPASVESASPSPSTSSPSAQDGCRRSDGNCLGVLRSGAYRSSAFDVFSAGPVAGQLTYRVRGDAWANALDHAAGYWFQPARDYAASNGDGILPGVYLFSDVAPASQSYPICPETSEPSAKADARSLVAWIKRLPDLRATDLPPLRTADGEAPGVAITVEPGTQFACGDRTTVRTLVASRPGASDPYVWGIAAGQRIEVYFQDLGGGHTLGILFHEPSGAFPPGLRAEAVRLASTFKVHRPG